MADLPSGTVTLLFSDVEGSTRLLRRTGDGYAALLETHRELLREAFRSHGGVDAGSEGDSCFAVFASPGDAAEAAAAAQQALASYDWPGGNDVRVRIGLHTGEARNVGGHYVGLDVHVANRVMAAGHGGQVVVSETTRSQLEPRFELRDLGAHRLKDLPSPLHLYQLLVDGLPGEFPPLATLDGHATNLPAPSNAFIGRAVELREVGELLRHDDVRLLTLTGPGGAGKTRLALQAAAAAVEEFGDGVFFVSLSPVREAELVVPTVAQTLGVREQSGEQVLETLTEYLREKQLLLVLDNLEQVVAAAPTLAGLLAAAPRLKLLATSRSALRVSGERNYALQAMTVDDAVRLFAERARAAGAAPDELADDTVIAEICGRLDGLPLAIELAASRARTLGPRALLRRLGSRLTLLTGGAQDLDDRQRTLRGTIEWSYDLLSPLERRLFARLAVFVGGFRLEAAEGVCAPGGERLLDDLDALVESSLLRRREDADGEQRFFMLETIREFALERLVTSGEAEDVRRTHAEWFAGLAERLDAESRTGDQPAAIARLESDYPNLRAAVAWGREQRDGELLLRLVTALWPFWATRGHVAEGRRALEDAFAIAGRRPARALLGLSSLRVFSGSSDGVLDDVHQALSAAEELGDPLTLAQAWNLLGRIEGTLLGLMAQADEAWAQARAYAERASLRAERAEAIGWLMMSANFGPLPVEEGIARCKELREAAADDPVVRANSLVEQAALEAMRGEFEVARELLATGRQSLAELGFTLLVAMSAQEAHYVEILAGDPAAAVGILRESYDQLEPMGERAYLSTAAALLAHAFCDLGELDEAERFSRVGEDASAPDDLFSQILWRSGRAKVFARRGERAEAERLARAAVELAATTDLLNVQGDSLADLADVLLLAGRRDQALPLLEQSAERFARKGNRVALERVERRARELAEARA